MHELPNPLNVGDPNIPSRSVYLLHLTGQQTVPGTERLHRGMSEATFRAYFRPHPFYPGDLVPYTEEVERPLSGEQEHMALVKAVFSDTGEVIRARVITRGELPKEPKRSSRIKR